MLLASEINPILIELNFRTLVDRLLNFKKLIISGMIQSVYTYTLLKCL